MKTLLTAWTAVAVLMLAACATQQQPSSVSPRSPNQLKQEELKAMEAQGQRNDFDRLPGLSPPAQ